MKTKIITVNDMRSGKLQAIKSSGTRFGYCINCYDGCEHGCLYCYGRLRRVRKYESWIHAKPTKGMVDRLKYDVETINQIPELKDEIKDIFVCSVTDGYQPKELQYRVTRQVIETLIENGLPFTVLTKSVLVLRDLDLFKGYDKCRIGITIITLDDNIRRQLEPYSSSIAERCWTLEVLKKNGISTYCSVEPVMPCEGSDPIAIVKKLGKYVDLFEFGMWTPKAKKPMPLLRYDEEYLIDVFDKLFTYCDQKGINYCTAGHSKKRLEEHGLKHKPYPLVMDSIYQLPPVKNLTLVGAAE